MKIFSIIIAVFALTLNAHAQSQANEISSYSLNCNAQKINTEYVLRYQPLSGIYSVSEATYQPDGVRKESHRSHQVIPSFEETRLVISLTSGSPVLLDTPIVLIVLKTKDFFELNQFPVLISQTTTAQWAEQKTIFESGICKLKKLNSKK